MINDILEKRHHKFTVMVPGLYLHHLSIQGCGLNQHNWRRREKKTSDI